MDFTGSEHWALSIFVRAHTYIHTYTLLMLPKWAFQLNNLGFCFNFFWLVIYVAVVLC